MCNKETPRAARAIRRPSNYTNTQATQHYTHIISHIALFMDGIAACWVQRDM